MLALSVHYVRIFPSLLYVRTPGSFKQAKKVCFCVALGKDHVKLDTKHKLLAGDDAEPAWDEPPVLCA